MVLFFRMVCTFFTVCFLVSDRYISELLPINYLSGFIYYRKDPPAHPIELFEFSKLSKVLSVSSICNLILIGQVKFIEMPTVRSTLCLQSSYIEGNSAYRINFELYHFLIHM